MLERQQGQLVCGLQDLYHRLLKAGAWEGLSLDESNGHPLTHDILSALDRLESKNDDSGDLMAFEGSCEQLQSELIAGGAGYCHRRGSLSSHSAHSHHDSTRPAPSHDTPVQLEAEAESLKENLNEPDANPLPRASSPVPWPRPPTLPQVDFPVVEPDPVQAPCLVNNDPLLYAPGWAQALAARNYDEQNYLGIQPAKQSGFDTPLSWPWYQQPSQFSSLSTPSLPYDGGQGLSAVSPYCYTGALVHLDITSGTSI